MVVDDRIDYYLYLFYTFMTYFFLNFFQYL